ncbi:hypothetical protein AXF42_Ash020111 [Apostasia shenzhenica]|uniref:Uncharacterized protein n=1 Tax=Apostasia shenzhenica TaxID=1088818 RepID=A0A2I0A3P8_9ASPA|nr:hypothetical protein AXF42_Ash020111 [Apostasia shenzhenica]
MGAPKADNNALREKLKKVAEDQEATITAKSAAAVEAYKISLPYRKERLEEIRRAWEGVVSSLIQEGKITADDLAKVEPISCLATDPIYKKEGLDLTDDFIQQMFDLLDKAGKD